MVVWVGMASYYHLSDYTVAIVALSSNALWSITLACITGPSLWWLTIIATALGALEGSIKPALCTLITTIPDQKDIGKIFAFLGLLECIWRIVDQTLYTYVYNVLVESFPQVSITRKTDILQAFNLYFVIDIDHICTGRNFLHNFDCSACNPETRLVKTTCENNL